MNYLYHKVPENMKGKYLMPLNKLRKVYPKVYKEELKKYEGRGHLLKKRVWPWNCLWNDVIHLTAVHPRKLKIALLKSGAKSVKSKKWFRINVKNLKKSKTIVWTYPKGEGNKRNWGFVKYNIKDLKKYNKIGKDTLDYYKEKFSEGKKPLMFAWVPHILYKGKINISKCKIITLK